MQMPEVTTTPSSPFANKAIWLTGCALAFLFFFNEHSIHTSLKTAFTLSADEMVAEAGGGNSLRRLAFFTMAGCGIALFFARNTGHWKFPGFMFVLLGCTLCYATCSTLWSVDSGMTIRRLMVLFLALMGACGLSRAFTYRELIAIALLATGILVGVGLACELGFRTFRPWSGDYRFSGTLHPNTQGAYLAVLSLCALLLTRLDSSHFLKYGAILGVALVLLVLTKSRTSTAGVLAMLGITWLLMHHSFFRWALPLLGVWMASTLLLLAMLAGANVDHYLAKIAFMGREEDTESFSGRTTIWPTVTPYIHQRYWLGHGYDSFWTPTVIEDVTRECQWPVREAHSAYYETMLHLGFIGIALLISTILVGMASSYWTFFTTNNIAVLFWFAMPLNGLFNGLFESGMVMISLPTFLIVTGFFRLAFIRELAQEPRMRREVYFQLSPSNYVTGAT
jgi:exopolysaccharide production protein ExoQ